MTSRWILQAAFLLGFLSIALSINYEALELRQSSSNTACLELLKQLHGRLCLGHRIDFKIPTEVKHPGQMEKKDAAFVIQEMLQNIFIVFKNNSSSTGWNENIVESFLDKLDDQIEFLKKTLEEVPANERWTPRNYPTIRRLKSYYLRVQRSLEVKGYSSCAWMVVRAEILSNFSIIKNLTNIFQN
ncbi:interferon beta-like [Arvicola amphibius]|uniref:interferon beta-like n=1 Tax=Arvicola amphibius TaxID=1047088 RepID=UPI0018E2E910|nr:interferon beta-like [Arvicola amphibius]